MVRVNLEDTVDRGDLFFLSIYIAINWIDGLIAEVSVKSSVSKFLYQTTFEQTLENLLYLTFRCSEIQGPISAAVFSTFKSCRCRVVLFYNSCLCVVVSVIPMNLK